MTQAHFPTIGVRFNDYLRPEAAPYVIAAMHTPDYRHKADRLLESCTRHGLPIALYEVPAVHRSISSNGGDDLSLTKPAFIRFALQSHEKPVLYVDCDAVFHDRPIHVERLIDDVDFAAYNWMADPWNDVWQPISVQPRIGEADPDRFWGFHFAIDFYDPSQLICSGMTQLWGRSKASLDLLSEWQATIAAYPDASDDQCLDYAFNSRDNADLRYAWLGKEHIRSWGWPHVRPVIAHPDQVNEHGHRPIAEMLNKIRFDASRASPAPRPSGAFPRDAILDVREGALYQVTGNQLQRAGSAGAKFWL